jgi:hypothetical protein
MDEMLFSGKSQSIALTKVRILVKILVLARAFCFKNYLLTCASKQITKNLNIK